MCYDSAQLCPGHDKGPSAPPPICYNDYLGVNLLLMWKAEEGRFTWIW